MLLTQLLTSALHRQSLGATLLPHSKPLGLSASSSQWVPQHLPDSLGPILPEASGCSVAFLAHPTATQPCLLSAKGTTLYRETESWCGDVSSGQKNGPVAEECPQGDLGDFLPTTLSYVMALLRQ